MSVDIPTRSDLPHWTLQVVLENVTYTLEFRWNVRANAWFMGVLDAEGANYLITPRRLVANWPIAAYKTGRQPPGAFFVEDTSSQQQDPGPDDLGDRVKVVYYTKDEARRR